MNRAEFTYALRKRLSNLPTDDIDDRILFYNEMIDDAIEEGLTEEKAIENIGSIDEIYSQILAEVPLHRIIKHKINPKRKMSGAKIAIIASTSPIWISLLAAAFAVVISLFAVLWSVAISLWSLFISFAVSSPASILLSIMNICGGNMSLGAVFIACSLLLAGLAIFTFYGCKYVTKGTAMLTKNIIIGANRIIVG